MRNLWYWLPIIWNDRPWDYVFLLIVMKHKIKQMADSTPDWFHVNAEDIQQEMLDTVFLIDCLIDDRAEMDAMSQHEAIFGKPSHEFVATKNNELVEMVTTYPDADDDEVARKAVLAFAHIAEITRRITLQALGRAFMRIERWWD